MAGDFERLFGNFRPNAFNEDFNRIPQDVAQGNGNIMPTGWLEDDSVDSDVIRANAVIAEKIAANAVEADKIAANAVTAGKIAANAIEANHISAGAVETDKLAANAVTAAKIAANTITANEIAASAITADELATNSVTTNKIVAANVTSAKIELTISGKNFGANDGTASAPGVFFDSASTTGFLRQNGVPTIARIGTVAMGFGGNPASGTGTFNTTALPLQPVSSGTQDIGTSSLRYDTVFCVTLDESSDARLKRDIEDSGLGLDFIRQLRPRSYRWRDAVDTQAREAAQAKHDPLAVRRAVEPYEHRIQAIREQQLAGNDDPALEQAVEEARAKINEIEAAAMRPLLEANDKRRPGRRLHYGLVAQEVKDALDRAGIDAMDAGFWKEDRDGMQSLAYTELIAPLIRAVQELAARVEGLEAGN